MSVPNISSQNVPSYAQMARQLQEAGPVSNARVGTQRLAPRPTGNGGSLFPETGFKTVDKMGQTAKFAGEAVKETTISGMKGTVSGAVVGMIVGGISFGYKMITVNRKWGWAILGFGFAGGMMGAISRVVKTAKEKAEGLTGILMQ